MQLASLRFSRRNILIAAGLFILAIVVLLLVFKYKKKQQSEGEFSRYIDSYTAGIISRESTIRVRLSDQVQVTHAQNEELKAQVFDFSPSVKGKAYWVDAQTIEFRPADKLDPDKSYEVNFDLGAIVKVPDDFVHFSFGFQTIKPDLSITFNGLQTATNTSLDKMKLTGTVQTADYEDPAQIEKIITANYITPVTVKWNHNRVTKTHEFVINQVPRTHETSLLNLKWDANTLHIDRSGSEDFAIPAIGDFKLMDARAVQEQDQYVLFQFSNPIKIGQELNGLIGINNVSDLAYTIEGSMVKV
jgi:hypothetical protein